MGTGMRNRFFIMLYSQTDDKAMPNIRIGIKAIL